MRIEDKIVRSLSTWAFTIGHMVFVLVWCGFNMVAPESTRFDPYPFIFINFIVSLWAMIQNCIIMISAYKLGEGDRAMAQANHANTERILRHIHNLEKNLIGKIEELEEDSDA